MEASSQGVRSPCCMWGGEERGSSLETSATGPGSALNLSIWSQSRKSGSVSLHDFYQLGQPVMLGENFRGHGSAAPTHICKGPLLVGFLIGPEANGPVTSGC